MVYANQADYSRIISKTDLGDLLLDAAADYAGKTTDQVLEEAEEGAEAEIKKYLGARFDLALEFAKDAGVPGEAISREKTILRCFLTISTYFLHFSINPRDIPELRSLEFNRCISTLEGIRDGEIYTELTEKAGAEGRLSTWGGGRKFISKPFEDDSLFNDDDQ
jgi:phage gp36-like protein